MRRGGGRSASILIALAGAALLLLNFPLLLVWDGEGTLFGLPMLPVMLFLIWAGLIAALIRVSEGRPRPPREAPPHILPETPPPHLPESRPPALREGPQRASNEGQPRVPHENPPRVPHDGQPRVPREDDGGGA